MQFRLGISVTWLVDPKILRYPFYWYAFVFYETSILINVYISVVRWACVAIPFKVKSTFTVRGAIIAFITFFVSVFLLRVPMFMKKQIVREFDPFNNKTRVVYKEAEDGGLAEKMNDIVSRNILNWASFVTVIACLIVMVTKLRASVRFRSSNAQPNSPPHATATNNADIHNIQNSNSESHTVERSLCDKRMPASTIPDIPSDHLTEKTKNEPKNQKLKKVSCSQITHSKYVKGKSLASQKGQHKVVATKETQVVRSVILVAVIFVTCQTPLMVYTLARRYPFYWYAFVFYETSILINVYISVVRCACVAIPFKVKSTFTVRGAIIAFITFFVSAFLLRVPMFMKKQIVREFDPFNNKTRVVYKEAEDGGLAEKMNDIVSRNILNWASFVTVIACLIVMVTKLKASVRFRSSNAQHNSQPHATAINSAEIQNVQSNIPELTQSKTAERSLCDKWVSTSTMAHIQSDQSHLPEKIKEESKNQKPKKVSYPQTNQIKSAKNKSLTPDQGQHKVVATKETQVVRSVILVAAIFVTCQTPLMVYTLARRFESQFDDQDDKDSKNLQNPGPEVLSRLAHGALITFMDTARGSPVYFTPPTTA
ncbi:hypothetical protein RRG08_002230 [Elysia crispata]|uniref:G-protein coupled receptors family 1 profile domain-containing protein n=1 Tax=Elysia crispata TaxID=231223 RepID=A0AAE0ZCP5_9GAST|nr:hypothetical protein RRG08_002230 [Elysia crispata]